VSGGCRAGGDAFAEEIAERLDMTICYVIDGLDITKDAHTIFIHSALWDKHGKQAGLIRNTYIARDADILIALVAPDRKGGTEDTLDKHRKVQIIIQ